MTSSEGGYPALILYKNNIQHGHIDESEVKYNALILYKNNIQHGKTYVNIRGLNCCVNPL